MNNMECKDVFQNLRQLSLSVGEFIRYWGFRRVHGAVWTQIYLSKNSLSCTDLVKRLKLSKALISPAINELKEWNLIFEIPSHDEKTKLYGANENVEDVILKVIKMREAKMIKTVCKNLKKLAQNQSASELLLRERISSLENMVFSAQVFLNFILSTENILTKNPLEK